MYVEILCFFIEIAFSGQKNLLKYFFKSKATHNIVEQSQICPAMYLILFVKLYFHTKFEDSPKKETQILARFNIESRDDASANQIGA